MIRTYLCFNLGTTKLKSSLISENGKIIYLSDIEAKKLSAIYLNFFKIHRKRF